MNIVTNKTVKVALALKPLWEGDELMVEKMLYVIGG